MTVRTWFRRLKLRLFGDDWDGFPDPPDETFRAQLAAYRRVGVELDDDLLVEFAAAAWRSGFEAGWVNEEREYWRAYESLPEDVREGRLT